MSQLQVAPRVRAARLGALLVLEFIIPVVVLQIVAFRPELAPTGQAGPPPVPIQNHRDMAWQRPAPHARTQPSCIEHVHRRAQHLRDLIGVHLIDASWLAKLPPELAERLQQIRNVRTNESCPTGDQRPLFPKS